VIINDRTNQTENTHTNKRIDSQTNERSNVPKWS